ncbi:MAG: cyclophilin-like family protein [Thermofilaceae archaeon]
MIIALKINDLKLRVYLTPYFSPKTFSKVVNQLPLNLHAHVYGDTLIAGTGIETAVESHRILLYERELAYWPPAAALVIALRGSTSFGSPVNPLGYIINAAEELRYLKDGESLRIILDFDS